MHRYGLTEDGKLRVCDDRRDSEFDAKWLRDCVDKGKFFLYYDLGYALMSFRNVNTPNPYVVGWAYYSKKDEKESFCYLVFSSYEAFKKHEEETPIYFRRYFEYVRQNASGPGFSKLDMDATNRLFFDLDLKSKLYSETEYLHPGALQDLEDIITSTLKECYPEKTIPPLDFVWSDSCREGKYSYHLTVKGILFHDFYEHFPMIYWAVCFNISKDPRFSYVDQKYFSDGAFFDKSMLRNVLFRMVGSRKLGNNSYLKLVNDKYTLEDSLVRVVCVIHPDDKKHGWRNDEVLFRMDFKFAKQAEMEQVFGLKKKEGSYEVEGVHSQGELLEAFEFCRKNLEWFRIFEATNFLNGTLYLNNKTRKGFNCPACGDQDRHPKSSCKIWLFKEPEKHIIFGCWQSTGKKIAQLGESKQPSTEKGKKGKKEKKPYITKKEKKEFARQKLSEHFSSLAEEIATYESKGLARIYCEEMMKDRIFTMAGDKKLMIFLWNERRKFWEEIDRERFMRHVSVVMQPPLMEAMDKVSLELEALKDNKEDPGIEILKEILKTLEWGHKVFNSSQKTNAVIDFITGSVYDEFGKQFSRLNADPYMLPVADGKIINLKTLEVRDRVFEDYCRWEVPTRYTGKICDGFLKFISEIFLGDQEIIDFVRKLVGYSITGLTSEQKLIILHGSGGNGKTMFLEAIRSTLGEFYASADKTIFNSVKPGAPNPSLFRIMSARFVAVPETKPGDTFDADVVKRLTGGDTLTCRGLYKNELEFTPQWQLWVATNNIPPTSNAYSMERRLVLIKFNARFVNIEQAKKKEAHRLSLKKGSPVNWEEIELPPHFFPIDPKLEHKLKSDEYRESLLSWAISGAYDYIKEGIKYPQSVLDLVQDQMEECDGFSKFIDDRCILDITNGTYKYQSSIIYRDYVAYCKEQLLEHMSQKEFNKELEELGLESRKISSKYWIGIRPIPRENENQSLLFQN